MNKITKSLLFKGLALGLLSGYTVVVATCYTHHPTYERDCYAETNTPTPPSPGDGWTCVWISTEQLPNASNLTVSLTGGNKYSTGTKCTLTWRCTKPDEDTFDTTTTEDIDTEYDQKKGASCSS